MHNHDLRVGDLIEDAEKSTRVPVGTVIVDQLGTVAQYLPDGEGGYWWQIVGECAYEMPDDLFDFPLRVLMVGSHCKSKGSWN